MLKPKVHRQSNSTTTTTTRANFLLPKSLFNRKEHASLLIKSSRSHFNKARRCIRASSATKAVASVPKQSIKFKVTAVVIVKQTIGGLLTNLGIERGLDDIKDLLGKTLLLELVSTELDPNTKLEKPTIQGFAHRVSKANGDVKYEAEFEVPIDFGDVGAVFVENGQHAELFLQHIVLHGFSNGPVNVNCCSWVHSKYDNRHKRVFFTNKCYLPSQTPIGVRRLREEELLLLRGNGLGERKKSERIYDYDVYNDIGDPDTDLELGRPVFGGKQDPYPRRCRTGRPRCESDPSSEKGKNDFCVPRDEAFLEIKQLTFSAMTLYSLFNALIQSLGNVIVDSELGFPYVEAIDSLFNERVSMSPISRQGFWQTMLPRPFKFITERKDALRFETPPTSQRDRFFWLRDEEFARQTLAVLNPYSIQLVRSKLDPAIYGPPESAITTEIIEKEIGGIIKAIKQKKLFILDYHDLLLPFVSKVRKLKGTTLYGSRTIFFLTPNGTLRPLAIELTRPPMDGIPQWKQVYTHNWDSTDSWLWRLAKAHVLAHDSGFHQLVNHCVMHPIYRLLRPHFRYTMEINALARESLINAGGIIESSFSPRKYSMELSSVVYDKMWRFDYQALPKDLINRGMAVEDRIAPRGLKLTIEDYPFANDGLILWDIIKSWVTDYVNQYYPDPSLIVFDQELQAWWAEIRNAGHCDKKDKPGWPELKTPEDLIEIATIIARVSSGHHAAVNFGQYAFGGYFPNRPTIARIKMPNEDPTEEEWNFFLERPEAVLLATFPSKLQATTVMAVLRVLSNHSPDEEYIGKEMEPAWAGDPIIKTAFEKFSGRLKEFERIIDERNTNKNLKKRNGAGIIPYQLLKAFSKPGVTGQGVPYSISV